MPTKEELILRIQKQQQILNQIIQLSKESLSSNSLSQLKELGIESCDEMKRANINNVADLKRQATATSNQVDAMRREMQPNNPYPNQNPNQPPQDPSLGQMYQKTMRKVMGVQSQIFMFMSLTTMGKILFGGLKNAITIVSGWLGSATTTIRSLGWLDVAPYAAVAGVSFATILLIYKPIKTILANNEKAKKANMKEDLYISPSEILNISEATNIVDSMFLIQEISLGDINPPRLAQILIEKGGFWVPLGAFIVTLGGGYLTWMSIKVARDKMSHQ